jgi:cobalt-zinc-cadmium efflux system membrane fusion protein
MEKQSPYNSGLPYAKGVPSLMSSQESVLSRRELPTSRQLRIVLVVAVVAACLIAIGWGALRAGASEPNAHASGVDNGQTSNSVNANGGASSTAGGSVAGALRLTAAQLSTLEIRSVAAQPFRTEEFTDGRIALNGDTATQVFSPYSGRVLKVMSSPGEYVRKGAPLLLVEASEYVQAQSDLLNAAANLKLARANEERKHAAFESKGASLQDWQQTQADLSAAETAFAAARNRLHIFGKTDAEIAAIEKAHQPEATTTVVAPIAGIITDRQVGPGQYIQAGSSTPVFTIGDLSTVWLVADVRETEAPLIQRGQEVEVRVLAFPHEIFKAKLTAVAAGVDPVTRRVPVRATVPNPDGKLKPEMFASFSIITGGESVAPAVPEQALVREGDQARVWVLQADNTLTLRRIRAGRINDGMVEVLEGLKAGEKVVTRGSLFIDRAAQPG